MILKLPKEINRKVRSTVRSDCTLRFIHTIYRIFLHSFRYFLLFWKRIFLFCIRKAKNKKINVYLVDNTDDSIIMFNI